MRDRRRQVCPTCQDASEVNHSHFKPFMDQLQWDTQQQLNHQVAYYVLHTGWVEGMDGAGGQNILDHDW